MIATDVKHLRFPIPEREISRGVSCTVGNAQSLLTAFPTLLCTGTPCSAVHGAMVC